jgi:hypothetical protein
MELNVSIHQLFHKKRFRVCFIYIIAVFIVHDEIAEIFVLPTVKFREIESIPKKAFYVFL